MGSGHSVTHQSPSEWQHSLPACLLGFDRAGLAPAGFHQEVSPSHLRFPLFQVFPSAIFTVPTLTFGVLYCLFVIGHDRRRILHYNVTRTPMPCGLRCSCMKPGKTATGCSAFLIFDRDAKFSADVFCKRY
jgi:hypothetical protein